MADTSAACGVSVLITGTVLLWRRVLAAYGAEVLPSSYVKEWSDKNI